MSLLAKICLAVTVCALLILKGGLAVMGPLLRFAIPAIAIYFVYQYIKKQLALGAGKEDSKREAFKAPEVIKICPDCGSEMKKGHKCS
jgi:hypothetical protein